MQQEQPKVTTTFAELLKANQEGWAYLHLLNKNNGRLSTYGVDIDTLDWNGLADDVLEEDTNAGLEPFDELEYWVTETLADLAKAIFKVKKESIPFQDFGGQAFSEDLLAGITPGFEAFFIFEYEVEYEE